MKTAEEWKRVSDARAARYDALTVAIKDEARWVWRRRTAESAFAVVAFYLMGPVTGPRIACVIGAMLVFHAVLRVVQGSAVIKRMAKIDAEFPSPSAARQESRR